MRRSPAGADLARTTRRLRNRGRGFAGTEAIANGPVERESTAPAERAANGAEPGAARGRAGDGSTRTPEPLPAAGAQGAGRERGRSQVLTSGGARLIFSPSPGGVVSSLPGTIQT